MHVVSLGYVTVPTPGTPVPLGPVLAALNLPADKTQGGKCHCIEMWPLLSNTGIVYAGLSAVAFASQGAVMNSATGKNVIKQVQTPSTSGHQDFAKVCATDESNSVVVADYAIDAAVASNGFSVFLIVL